MGEDLGLDASRAVRQQTRKHLRPRFRRHHPARRASLMENVQGLAVENVQRRPGDKGQLPLGEQVHGAHIVSFDGEATVANDLAQHLQIGL